MMVVGGVYYFTSDRMIGHAQRDKYHIYLGETDHWLADDEQVFLVVNKADYGGCCPISTTDCPTLVYDSYVGCNGLILYPTNYLPTIEPTYQLTLSPDYLVKVRNSIAASEQMETWQIHFACGALAHF